MKGVSKYGQFKVRNNADIQASNNENVSTNNTKTDNLKLGTKITIQDGKVRAPLVKLFLKFFLKLFQTSRINANIPQQLLNGNKEGFVRLPLQNLTKSNNTITAAAFFRERNAVDNFEIYQDDQKEVENISLNGISKILVFIKRVYHKFNYSFGVEGLL